MSVAPKRPKGPPLNAMRAFEAAARHVSFVAAAEELNVTPGAISQHIKTLEEWVGTPLFRRNAQGITLTSVGANLMPKFTTAFDGLADATFALRNFRPDAEFHIAALPSLAQLWLPKRLARVRSQFPHINFSVTALETPPSLSRELFDLSIFIGAPDRTLDQICVCADEIVPVCAPSVLETFAGFDHCALLHDQSWSDDWQTWADSARIAIENPRRGAQFSLYSLAVEEAKAGAGVLIGHVPLIEEALASGTLVKADDRACKTGLSILLNLPRASRQQVDTQNIAAAFAELH